MRLLRKKEIPAEPNAAFYYTAEDAKAFGHIQSFVIQPLLRTIPLWIEQHELPQQFDPLSRIIEKLYHGIKSLSDDSAEISCQSLAQMLQHQQQFDRTWHETQWWKLPEALRLSYWQALQQYFPTEQQPLLTYLLTLPDASGRRLKMLLQQRDWQRELGMLWVKDKAAAQDNLVRVDLVEQDRVATHFLHPVISAQLFTASGEFKPKDEKIPGHHRVYPLEIEGKSRFWFKLYPEQPGTEEAIYGLDTQLGVFGTPSGQLIKIYAKDKQKKDKPFAMYISQHVAGENLEEILNHNPEKLAQLDPASFVQTLLRVLLTNPEDDKGNDYFLVNIDGRYVLMRIDNERGFFPIEAHTGKLGSSELQVKSVLYCFDAMSQPLWNAKTQTVINDFLKLEPVSLVMIWLHTLQLQQGLWQKLFNVDEVLTHFRENESLPVMMLPDGLEREILNRLMAMQTVLQLKPQATGLDLLTSVQPKLARYYREIHQHLSNDDKPYQHTLKRFMKVAGALYKKDKQGHLQSTIQGAMAISQSLRLPGRLNAQQLKAIYAGEMLSPEKVLVSFNEWQKQSLPHLYQQLIIDIEKFEDAKAIKAAQVAQKIAGAQFQQLPLRHKRIIIEDCILPKIDSLSLTTQTFILKIMAGTPWHELRLSPFKAVLTDALLESLLKGANVHLIKLDISSCILLTNKAGKSINRYCHQLTHLLAKELNWETLTIKPELTQLQILVVDDCRGLKALTLQGLQLLNLTTKNCYNLKKTIWNSSALQNNRDAL